VNSSLLGRLTWQADGGVVVGDDPHAATKRRGDRKDASFHFPLNRSDGLTAVKAALSSRAEARGSGEGPESHYSRRPPWDHLMIEPVIGRRQVLALAGTHSGLAGRAHSSPSS
jgi:hypothetical protein